MNYKDTLNLPQTDFPMKANLAQREPEQLKTWKENSLYAQLIEHNKDKPAYILHDGPPYANGHLHLGTILNKILKDIVVKYKNMAGFKCEYVPGWDCHGLPIELEVDKKLGGKKRELSPLAKRKACREHAEKFVNIQREEFQRLGCLGKWEAPYQTMSFAYEATIAREFGKFVKNEGVYREKKPILWCPSCETALAEAEVEYADHEAPSIYVKFELKDDQDFRKEWKLKDEKIYVVIWTTTPWTIPANLGICLHPDLPYVAVKVDGEVWIMAEGLMETVMAAAGKTNYLVIGQPTSQSLEHKHCHHPLIDRPSILILGEHVTLEAGTGAVHTAPGHGQEDYEVGLRYGLDVFAPVDSTGKFTSEVNIDGLQGLFVEAANDTIIEKLKQVNALVKSDKVSHSYPHCWRCKKPIIFRSTEQWFISMKKNDLRQKSLEAIENVQWIPPWGRNRIHGMVSVRPDWCISRQRIWGVPIVAVVCESCGSIQTSPELVENAALAFEKQGADAWFSLPVEDLLPVNFKCSNCGETKQFGKENDILDVWFDSGVSYAAVLENTLNIKEQADLYLEGSDQHRGWFHTSLLTSIGTRGRAPYKRVLTHGFVVDGQGKKYSKSAKNYVPPEELIKKHGAEIIRYWVAAEDYRDDIRFSDEILTRLIDSYRKIRNTCRYIVSNLNDFNPDRDALAYKELKEIDKFALHDLQKVVKKVEAAYNSFQFHVISQELNRFCIVDLSAFVFDIMKDRLYCEKKDGDLRRSGQTVLWQIGEALVRLMAPILSFTADELWKHLPAYQDKAKNVFFASLPQVEEKYINEELGARWEKMRQIREVATKALEMARAEKFIGNPLEAKLILETTVELKEFLKSFGADLPDLFIVSQVEFGSAQGNYIYETEEMPGLKVAVAKASGAKCGRCWKFADSVGENKEHPEICARCANVI
ncbi:MAG: isoleucine--tRNA ligase [Pseudomonadota bacterium]